MYWLFIGFCLMLVGMMYLGVPAMIEKDQYIGLLFFGLLSFGTVLIIVILIVDAIQKLIRRRR